jgi:recombination protein RecT
MSTANALSVISGDIYEARVSFDNALVDRSINFDREAGFAIQQLGKNDYMMKAAQNNRQAVVDAVVNIAAIGISLNPAKKQAYLVPRDNKICLDISYMGLMDLAQATGSVKWAQAALVHELDTFSLNGLDKAPSHTFNPFSKDRGLVVGVYVTIKTIHDEYLTHTMTIEDAYAIRDRSSAWKSWIAKKAISPGPWGTDEGEMIKKTCVKQAYKYWPKTERLETAIHHLNTENGEGLAVIADEAGAKPVVTKISARDSMKEEFDSLTPERQNIVMAVVNAVTDRFNADDFIGAYDEYSGLTENSERMGAWYFLPSNVRTAINKHTASLKQQKAA